MKEKIHAYIKEELLNEEVEINDDTPLYSSDLITSVEHIKLIHFLERSFEIAIPTNKISVENFDTIDSITQFINDKKVNCDGDELSSDD